MKYTLVTHTLPPFVRPDSEVLILGTMPSPKSREISFYYGHPQNRFWRVLAALFDESVPQDNTARQRLLQVHKIALWDVLACCEICGASDASIRNAQPNDVAGLVRGSRIARVFTTGKRAYDLYRRFCEEKVGLPAELLPSTSPANAAMSLEKLIEAYKKIVP